jgi:hypothetical protein
VWTLADGIPSNLKTGVAEGHRGFRIPPPPTKFLSKLDRRARFSGRSAIESILRAFLSRMLSAIFTPAFSAFVISLLGISQGS